MIELQHVTKVFGPRAKAAQALLDANASKDDILAQTGCTVGLSDVSLSIAKGELCMVMGLSGSGKSTLVRLLNRLIEPTSGMIAVDGEDIGALDAAGLRAFRQQKVSMVFQSFALLPHRCVRDNVAYGLELQGRTKEERRAVADDWIARVGLDGFADARPDQLSGGMRQRVGLARAFAAGTDILLMDEPFSALDPIIRREMQELLAGLQESLGKTIVFITHDLGEALALADRIGVLKDGELVQCGTPEDITDKPATDYVRRFVEAVRPVRLRGGALPA